MSRQQIDSLDRRILEMLTVNARVPFLEIARDTGVSGASIHQRIQKLTNSGVIKGFETIIDPSIIGYETCAYVGLSLNNPKEADNVVDLLQEIDEVVECNATTGRFDILLKVYARNNDHLYDIIKDRIAPIGGRTETLISFSRGFRRQVVIAGPEKK